MLTQDDWEFCRQLALHHWFLADNPVSTSKQNFKDPDFLATVDLSTGVPEDRAAALIAALKSAPVVGPAAPLLTFLAGLRDTPGVALSGESVNRLDALAARVVTRAAAFGADVYTSHLLLGNRVFMNRTDLREDLRTLVQTDDKLVLRVFGEAPGTSYTKELVLHIASNAPFYQAVVDLSEYSEPEEAIGFLAVSIDPEARLPEGVTEDRTKNVRYWTQWLVGLANSSGRNIWFVLDQCDAVDSKQPILNMIARLGEAVRMNSGATHRVLLLGHKKPLSDELRGRYLDNETRPLTHSDVRQTLRIVADNVAGEVASDATEEGREANLDSLADTVWAIANQGGALDPEGLCIALEEAIVQQILP